MGNILSNAGNLAMQNRIKELETDNKSLISSVENVNTQLSGLSFVVCTQEEYDTLPTPRPENTIYIIREEVETNETGGAV